MKKILYFLFFVCLFIKSFGLSANKTNEIRSKWYLKDGSVIVGQLVEENEKSVTIETKMGRITIERDNLKKLSIKINYKDGTVLIGEILEENETNFKIESKIGVLDINKNEIESFEKNYIGTNESRENGLSEERQLILPDVKKEKIEGGYSEAFEPIIDVFMDPTGATLKRSEIYLSGFSLAYGFSDKFLASINLLKLAGITFDDRGELNPNIELKYKIFKIKSSSWENNFSMGVRLESFKTLGYEIQLKKYHEPTEEGKKANKPENIGPKKIVRVADREVEENNANEKNDKLDDDSEFSYRIDSESQVGAEFALYIANTSSWIMSRGGRFSWHQGIFFKTNTLLSKINKWGEYPSYRVYTGFDIDLSRKFKLLGEVFYDPDYYNWRISTKGVGVDFGIMYAFSETFRFLIHLDLPIIGFYWRL